MHAFSDVRSLWHHLTALTLHNPLYASGEASYTACDSSLRAAWSRCSRDSGFQHATQATSAGGWYRLREPSRLATVGTPNAGPLEDRVVDGTTLPGKHGGPGSLCRRGVPTSKSAVQRNTVIYRDLLGCGSAEHALERARNEGIWREKQCPMTFIRT